MRKPLNDDMLRADFEQSGVLRTEYRAFTHKYIIAIFSAIVSFVGLYSYLISSNKQNAGLFIGVILLGFGAFNSLLLGVKFFTDQAAINEHHIRNQASHRQNKNFRNLLTLKGIKLFTRQRAMGGTVRFFIPHWTTRNQFSLVVGMLLGAFMPIFMSYFFWEKVPGLGLHHWIIGFIIELSLAVWILDGKLMTIFSPLVEARVVIPDNPVPSMDKVPKDFIPLELNLQDHALRRTRLFWITFMCLFVSFLSIIVKFMWKTQSPNEHPIAYPLVSIMPYIMMMVFTVGLNRYFFDKHFYRHNGVSLSLIFTTTLFFAIFIICSFVLSIILLLPATTYYWSILTVMVLGSWSIYVINSNCPVSASFNITRAYWLSLLWILACFLFFSCLIKPGLFNNIAEKEFASEIIKYYSDNYTYYLLLLLSLVLFYGGIASNYLHSVKNNILFILVPIVSSISLGLFSLVSLSSFNNKYPAIWGPISLMFCVLLITHLFSLRHIRESALRRLIGYCTLFFLGALISILMEYFSPWPWLSLLLLFSIGSILYFSKRVFYTKKIETDSKLSKILTFAGLFLISLFLVTLITKASGERFFLSYILNLPPFPFDIHIAEVIPFFNIASFAFALAIIFYMCTSAWFKIFYFTNYKQNHLSLSEHSNDIWHRQKWQLDTYKKWVFNLLKLLSILTAIILSYIFNYHNSYVLLFLPASILVYLTVSSIMFQTELLIANSWKVEFQGMHLLADSINEISQVNEIINLFKRHGIDEKDLYSYIGIDASADSVKKFRKAIRQNIDESYLTMLKMMLNRLFIIEHSVLTPAMRKRNPKVFVNSDSCILPSRIRWYNSSNLILTPIKTFFLLPWYRELLEIYDQLGQPIKLWRRRADIITSSPINSAVIREHEEKKEITVLLSSESSAGMDKLLQLSYMLKNNISTTDNYNFKFTAIEGGEKYRKAGIPFLFSLDKTGGTIGLGGVLNIIKNILKFYPAGRIIRLRPDIIILSDSSFINIELANFAKQVNEKIKLVYYVPPQAEMYTYSGDERAEKVLKFCDIVFTTTSYQDEHYRNLLVKLIKDKNPKEKDYSKVIIKRISFPQIYHLDRVIGPAIFHEDEFRKTNLSAENLLTKIVEDCYGIEFKEKNTIDKLNEVLQHTNFFEMCRSKDKITSLTEGIQTCVDETKNYLNIDFASLEEIRQNNILNLNRFILELIYSELCPPNMHKNLGCNTDPEFTYGFLLGSRPSEWIWSFKLFKFLLDILSESGCKFAVLLSDEVACEKFNNCLNSYLDTNKVQIFVNWKSETSFNTKKLSRFNKLGDVITSNMAEFLVKCEKIISVSGTAATEASFVRPTKTVYYISKNLVFLTKFLRLTGFPNNSTINDIFEYLRTSNFNADNESNWWHFSLVNWLIKKASNDDNFLNLNEELKDILVHLPSKIVNEKLILWDEVKSDQDWINIANELLDSKSWENIDQIVVENIKQLMERTLLVEKINDNASIKKKIFINPESTAAEIITDEIIKKEVLNQVRPKDPR